MITPLFLLTFAFALFCAYMARHALANYRRADASNHWPTTEGVLVDVHLWGTRNIDGEMINAENLRVTYEYDIEGIRYSGSEVAFYHLHYPETVDFAKAHPQGSSVRVFYNPKNHAASVLISGAHPTKPYGELILAFSGVFISVAVSVAAWMGL